MLVIYIVAFAAFAVEFALSEMIPLGEEGKTMQSKSYSGEHYSYEVEPFEEVVQIQEKIFCDTHVNGERTLELKSKYEIAVGSVLIGFCHDGSAVREKVIAINGQKFTTKSVHLSEVFKSAKIQGSFNMNHIVEQHKKRRNLKTFKLKSFDWNVNGKELYSTGPFTLSCSTCDVHFQPTVNFSLSLGLGHVNEFTLIGIGQLTATANMMVHATKTFSGTKEVNVDTLKLPKVYFTVYGFPVVLTTTLPINAGYSFNVNAAAQVTAGMKLEIDATAGVQKDSKDEPLKRVGSFTPTLTAIKPTFYGSADVTATAYLKPNLSLNVDGVGQASVDLIPKLLFSGHLDTNMGKSGELDGEFSVNVAGRLGVKIGDFKPPPDEDLGTYQIFDKKIVIWKA